MECPPVDTLLEFAAQSLNVDSTSTIRKHLQECGSCRLVMGSRRDNPPEDEHCTENSAEEMADTMLSPGLRLERATNRPNPVPTNIGRFAVIDVLGVGASGIVYSGRDPQLDRLVAIKLLVDSDSATHEQRVILTKEAQAMAKVRHENVVTIYETGVVDDRVYLVMELVRGMPLGQWLSEHHSTPEILSTFLQAGAGLAAAHRAGIVHRDFKPANVFVGHDASVRVGDFGLARMEVDQRSSGGEIVGTPAYMSPEQFLGKTSTAKSDQYSFCVSLYEALVGERPNKGSSFSELRKSVLTADGPPRASDALNAHIFSLLQRGLSQDPSQRFASMSGLLEELSRDPAAERRKRRVVALGGVVGIGVIGGLTMMALHSPKPALLCNAVESHLTGVWDEGIRSKAATQFRTFDVGRSDGQSTFGLVRRRLDRYAGDWVSLRTEVCEATQVRGEKSEAVMQLQMDCLDRRLSEFRELTLVVLQAGDPTVLDRVVGAASGMTDVSSCKQIERLSEQFPMPENENRRRMIMIVRNRLDRANILYQTGQYTRAQRMLSRLVADAKNTEYPPIEAEALYHFGVVQASLDLPIESEQSLRSAVQVGARAKHDLLVQKAWMELLQVIGVGQRRPTEALALRSTVEAAMGRTGDTPIARVQFLSILGEIATGDGQFATAKSFHEQALELAKQELGEDSLSVAHSRQVLGNVLYRLGDYVEAKRLFELAMPVLTRILGAKHPEVGNVVWGLASNAAAHGDNQQAEKLYAEALVLMKRAMGAKHRSIALLRAGLADVQSRTEKYELAAENYHLALDIYRNSPEENDPDIAPVLNGLAILFLHQHKRNEALPYLVEALAALENKWPDGHPSIAQVETNIGLLHGGLGRDQLAQEHCEHALEIGQMFYPKNSQNLLGILNCLATSALKLKEYEKARQLFERAREGGVSHPVLLAELEFGLAQTLIHTGGKRAEAKRLATKARAVFVSGGVRMEDSVLEVDTWLLKLR